MKNINNNQTGLAKDGPVFSEHKACRGSACLPRQNDLKENMLEICIFQHYTNIFRTRYPDSFHMLAWRREVARPCVTVAVSMCYKKNGSRHTPSTETRMQVCGKAPCPQQGFYGFDTWVLCAKGGPGRHDLHMWCVKRVRPEG